ncbi:MAG TPA: VUT family protein [Kofleriaceae bacterium]|jgi:hypothetical protein
MTSYRDRWLLPSRQREYPSRRVLSEGHLHARREATFLVLAGTFLLAAAMLPVLGTTRVLDLSELLGGVELPIALLLPVGVLAFPLSFTAIDLVCELWGRRRANALVMVGLVLNLGLLGLLAAVDRIPDAAGQESDSTPPALAFVACIFVAHMFNAQAYQALRRQARGRRGMWMRRNVSALIALIAGWVVFALVLYTYAVQVAEQPSDAAATQVASLAVASAVYCMVAAIIDTLPFVFIARSLVVFLRMGRFELESEDYAGGPMGRHDESIPPPRRAALVVETAPPPPPALPPPPPRPASSRISGAFTSSEKRFFTEGEELETGDVEVVEGSGSEIPARGQSA